MKTIDIRINAKLIRSYKPCIDGIVNFNKHYTDISIKQLINSKNISYRDKLWLLKKIIPTELLILWAIDSAIESEASAFAACEYSATYSACEYSVISSTYRDFAFEAATTAANAVSDCSNAAYHAGLAASYAAQAARSYDNAQNERLQALLYLIENEG